MLVEIKVPQLAESVTEASLGSWHKRQGEFVRRGENLIDIETDKVVLEVTAPQDGVLKEIRKGDGHDVASDEVIALIETEVAQSLPAPPETWPDDADELQAFAPEKQPSEPVAAKSVATEKSQGEEPAPPKPFIKKQPDGASDVRTSPTARRLLTEHGLNAEEVVNDGRQRISREDVQSYVDRQHQGSAPNTPALHHDAARAEKRVPMTRLRKRVAERLLQAQSNAAILSTFNEINLAKAAALREQYKAAFEVRHGVRLGYMSFFIAAAVEALKRHPIVNARVDGDDIVYHDFYDIGIAVASPRGLVVPILRDADQLGFAQIESAIHAFGQKANDNSLEIQDLTGGTFTITNGGVFGSLLSTPILNPPQSAILGMHTIQQRPIAENGEVVIRPMMYVALSYDHRIIDGKDAVQFLVDIKQLIEDPSRLLLNV